MASFNLQNRTTMMESNKRTGNMNFDKLKLSNKTMNLQNMKSNQKLENSKFFSQKATHDASNAFGELLIIDNNRLDFQRKMSKSNKRQIKAIETGPENLLDCLIVQEKRPLTAKNISDNSMFSKPKSKGSRKRSGRKLGEECFLFDNAAIKVKPKAERCKSNSSALCVSDILVSHFSTNNSKKSMMCNAINVSNLSRIDTLNKFNNNSNVSNESFLKSTELMTQTKSKNTFSESSQKFNSKKVKFLQTAKASNTATTHFKNNMSQKKQVPRPSKKYSTDTVLLLNRQISNAIIHEEIENENNAIPSTRHPTNYKAFMLAIANTDKCRCSHNTDNLTHVSKHSAKAALRKSHTYNFRLTPFEFTSSRKETEKELTDDSSHSSIFSRYRNLIAKDNITNNKLVVKCKEDPKNHEYMSPKIANRVETDCLRKASFDKNERFELQSREVAYNYNKSESLPILDQMEVIRFDKLNPEKINLDMQRRLNDSEINGINSNLHPSALKKHSTKSQKQKRHKVSCFNFCFF